MTREHRRRTRRRINPLKVLRLLLVSALLVMLGVVLLLPSPSREQVEQGGTLDLGAAALRQAAEFKVKNVYDLERSDTVSRWLAHLDEMPRPTRRLKVNYLGALRPVFNDSNHVHLAEAERYGIAPLDDTSSHWRLRRPIVKVTTCADYFLDTLVYSRPYLVPEAEAALREIGHRFRDTVRVRGGGGQYRIKVTSLLRTPLTVSRLRRRNRNAIDSSVHRYGTTFDISYAQFVASAPEPAYSVDDLKGVLAEVLLTMRQEGRIFVKYETGQPCFHITARKPHDQ